MPSDFTFEEHARYGTSSHINERLANPNIAERPYAMKWSDMHPGKRILPPGSAPAGEDEINWEETLGGKFAAAMTQLEGLLYALWGGRPRYDTSPKQQWYERTHPRCLWGPESWEETPNPNPYNDWIPDCEFNDYAEDTPVGYPPAPGPGKEYAALGNVAPCCVGEHRPPQVPIRPRSCDSGLALLSGEHNTTYFPAGSFGREEGSGGGGDPRAEGDFGTDPDVFHVEGEEIRFYWTKPVELPTPQQVELVHGGDTTPMTGGPLEYSATIGPYSQDTEVSWFIRVRIGNTWYYEPGDLSPPPYESRHKVTWFTHYNPYGRGLPEMLDICRKGTDRYHFDGAETIQPELLNMARFTLSYIVGQTCGDHDLCQDPRESQTIVHHNPRFRPDPTNNHGYCCINMPIRWRWSGSAPWPQYIHGGKGRWGGAQQGGIDPIDEIERGVLGPLPQPPHDPHIPAPPDWDDVRPLHNHPSEPAYGSQRARKSWRGIDMLFRDGAPPPRYPGDPISGPRNPFYGGGNSWEVMPALFRCWWEPTIEYSGRTFNKYDEVGLRSGDVIAPIHILEIIDAIEYLITYGVWTMGSACSRKRTPGTYMGEGCGHMHGYGATTAEHRELWVIQAAYMCCAPGWSGWYVKEILNGEVIFDDWIIPLVCDDWEEPTWQECWDPCQHTQCGMMANRRGTFMGQRGGSAYNEQVVHHEIWCDEGATTGCGKTAKARICFDWDPETQECTALPAQYWSAHFDQVEGWSKFLCTPRRCVGGPDNDHGGPFRKARFDHEFLEGGPFGVSTGTPGKEASGNCLGDIYGCGELFPGVGSLGMWFEEVIGVYWEGLAQSWWGASGEGMVCHSCCWSLGEVQAWPPPVEAFGYENPDPDASDPNLCETVRLGDVTYTHSPGGGGGGLSGCADGHRCSCATWMQSVCQGDKVWVATNLNLDDSGRVYRYFLGPDDEYADDPWVSTPYPDQRPGIPRLRNYDLSPEGWEHYSSVCPCESWTNPEPCWAPDEPEYGACCVGTSCFLTDGEVQCNSLSGVWMGAGSTCSPHNPCIR